jgi:hypothetical protein
LSFFRHLWRSFRERPPPRLRDPHAGDLDRLAAADTRSAFAVASPARVSSTICLMVKPRASMIASVQPSRQEASNSSARRPASTL